MLVVLSITDASPLANLAAMAPGTQIVGDATVGGEPV
jgi:hypothetical protein